MWCLTLSRGWEVSREKAAEWLCEPKFAYHPQNSAGLFSEEQDSTELSISNGGPGGHESLTGRKSFKYLHYLYFNNKFGMNSKVF